MDANTCPTCGSDCNERDELTKAEREITRLSAEVDALKRTHDEAMKRSHEVTQEMARQFETEVEALRADANALFGALARLHYAPWKLDSTDAEYREWSQAMHEASAAIQRHRDAAPAAPQQAEPVAWVRNLTDAQPHCVTGLQYRTAADADAGVQYIPLYLHPPAAEVQRLREALKPFAAIDLTTNQAVDAMDVLRARRALEGK